MENRTAPPPIEANTSSRSDNSPRSSSAPGRPPPLTLSAEQVEDRLRAAAARADGTQQRTAPTPARAAFDRVLEQAGGNIVGAKAIVERENREACRTGQRIAAAFAFESPAEAAERNERLIEAERQRYLAAATIPKKYSGASVETFAHVPDDCREQYQDAVSTLRHALGRKGSIVALLGTRGPGKTYMACALVREHCRRLIQARYAVTVRYFAAIKEEFRPGGDEGAAERSYREPHLLVLDEIQVKGETSWQSNRLTDLIDYRYGEDKVTVLMGNVVADDFASLVGDSVADRVHDGGGVIECTWPSLRGRIAD